MLTNRWTRRSAFPPAITKPKIVVIILVEVGVLRDDDVLVELKPASPGHTRIPEFLVVSPFIH
jgi:hypothetical protein